MKTTHSTVLLAIQTIAVGAFLSTSTTRLSGRTCTPFSAVVPDMEGVVDVDYEPTKKGDNFIFYEEKRRAHQQEESEQNAAQHEAHRVYDQQHAEFYEHQKLAHQAAAADAAAQQQNLTPEERKIWQAERRAFKEHQRARRILSAAKRLYGRNVRPND